MTLTFWLLYGLSTIAAIVALVVVIVENTLPPKPEPKRVKRKADR